MAQIGLNMGSRHARILGWAKSFNHELTTEEMIDEDTDLLGAMSLFWAIVKANIPEDIIQPTQDLLDSGFPSMATRNIPQGLLRILFSGDFLIHSVFRLWVLHYN